MLKFKCRSDPVMTKKITYLQNGEFAFYTAIMRIYVSRCKKGKSIWQNSTKYTSEWLWHFVNWCMRLLDGLGQMIVIYWLSGPCIMQIGSISSRGKKDKSRFYQSIYNSSSKHPLKLLVEKFSNIKKNYTY